MSLITLILVLAVVGFILWLVLTYIPMPEPYKKTVIVIVVVILILFLMRILGLDITIPRL